VTPAMANAKTTPPPRSPEIPRYPHYYRFPGSWLVDFQSTMMTSRSQPRLIFNGQQLTALRDFSAERFQRREILQQRESQFFPRPRPRCSRPLL